MLDDGGGCSHGGGGGCVHGEVVCGCGWVVMFLVALGLWLVMYAVHSINVHL